MTLYFLQPALLWALPVALLPLLLHLRQRQRQLVTDFPGAFFLVEVAQPAGRPRRRLEDLALLALRCSLIAIAIMALAGPSLRGAPAWLAGTLEPYTRSEAVVLAVDDTPSLVQARGPVPGQDFSGLLRRLARVLNAEPRRRSAVLLLSGSGRPFLSGAALEEAVQRLGGEALRTGTSGDRMALLERARLSLREVRADRKWILLLSDLGTNREEGAAGGLARGWRAALAALRQEAQPPGLVVLRPRVGPRRQWRIEDLRVAGGAEGGAAGLPLAGQLFTLAVEVGCVAGPGQREVVLEQAPLTLRPQRPPIAGAAQILTRQRLTLAPGDQSTVTATGLAGPAGVLRFQARFAETDELSFDDELSIAIPIGERQAVHLLDFRPAREAGLLAQDLALASARAALAPLPEAEGGRVRLVEHPARRLPAGRLQGLALLLHGPAGPELSQAQAEALGGAVRAGLQLLLVPDLGGNGTGVPRPPGGMVREAAWLPRAIECSEEAAGGPGRGGAWRLKLDEATHPLLEPFRAGRNGDLGALAFRGRLRLSLSPFAALGGGASGAERVLATFQDGAPALVYRRVEAGGVLQLAIGLETQGGLAASPAWPILVAEWSGWGGMGRGGTLLRLEAGAAAPAPFTLPVLPLSREVLLQGPWLAPAAFAERGGGQGAVVSAEGGCWRWTLPAGAGQVPLPGLEAPGSYLLEDPQVGGQHWLQVVVPEVESQLGQLPEEVRRELRLAAEGSGGAWLEDPGVLGSALAASGPGQALGTWCWAWLMLALGLECALLAWRGRSG